MHALPLHVAYAEIILSFCKPLFRRLAIPSRISRIGLHLPTRKIVPRAGRHGTIERYCARYMKYCCGAALVMAARLVIVPPVPAVTLFVVHTTGGIKLVVDNK